MAHRPRQGAATASSAASRISSNSNFPPLTTLTVRVFIVVSPLASKPQRPNAPSKSRIARALSVIARRSYVPASRMALRATQAAS